MPSRPPRHPERAVLCPQCKTAVKQLVSAVEDMPERGSLYICGACARVSEFTRYGLRLLSPAKLKALSNEEKSEIQFAVRNILAHSQHNKQL